MLVYRCCARTLNTGVLLYSTGRHLSLLLLVKDYHRRRPRLTDSWDLNQSAFIPSAMLASARYSESVRPKPPRTAPATSPANEWWAGRDDPPSIHCIFALSHEIFRGMKERKVEARNWIIHVTSAGHFPTEPQRGSGSSLWRMLGTVGEVSRPGVSEAFLGKGWFTGSWVMSCYRYFLSRGFTWGLQGRARGERRWTFWFGSIPFIRTSFALRNLGRWPTFSIFKFRARPAPLG